MRASSARALLSRSTLPLPTHCLLPPTSYFLLTTSYLLPLTHYLLLTASSLLLPTSCFLLPTLPLTASYSLPPPSCFLLPASCFLPLALLSRSTKLLERREIVSRFWALSAEARPSSAWAALMRALAAVSSFALALSCSTVGAWGVSCKRLLTHKQPHAHAHAC